MQKPTLSNTSVSGDRHKRFMECTQVFRATDTCIPQPPDSPTRTCKCCFRKLPTNNFYMRDRLHTPDSYCKECRKAANRRRRKSKECPATAPQNSPARIVIAHVQQREERLKLIMRALKTVRESIDRQREKQHQEELRKECNAPCEHRTKH